MSIKSLRKLLKQIDEPVGEILLTRKDVRRVLMDMGYTRSTARFYADTYPHHIPTHRSAIVRWVKERIRFQTEAFIKMLKERRHLTTRQREGLRLHREGLSYREVAHRLGISVASAYRLVKRGKENEYSPTTQGRDHQNGNQQMQTRTHIP